MICVAGPTSTGRLIKTAMSKAMRSSVLSDPEPYVEQSVSSGGAQPSAKAIYERRKNYTKTVAAMGEMSEYKVEVRCYVL